MERKKSLRAVIRWGAGYDSVDIKAAGRLGIYVANMPGVNAYAVAEHTLGLMIAAGRNLIVQNRLTHDGVWDNKLYAAQISTLKHKTVGIVGGGNIGRLVAVQVRACGAEVIYYDACRLPEETERRFGIEYRPLEELIQVSDIITLHIPLLDSTRHIINEERIARMKENVILINTARGGLIDEAALAKALAAKRVAAAGLDCVEDEDLTRNPLARMSNVIITPHVGGTSNDLQDEMVPQIAAQIKKLSDTGTLDHIVNGEYLA